MNSDLFIICPEALADPESSSDVFKAGTTSTQELRNVFKISKSYICPVSESTTRARETWESRGGVQDRVHCIKNRKPRHINSI